MLKSEIDSSKFSGLLEPIKPQQRKAVMTGSDNRTVPQRIQSLLNYALINAGSCKDTQRYRYKRSFAESYKPRGFQRSIFSDTRELFTVTGIFAL